MRKICLMENQHTTPCSVQIFKREESLVVLKLFHLRVTMTKNFFESFAGEEAVAKESTQPFERYT